MAKPGDEFVDQEGGRILFRQTAGTTDGELLEVEVIYPAHSNLPPLHYHPSQEERFVVKGGIIRTVIDEQENVYVAGDEFAIPPSTNHQMHNDSDEPGRVIWQTRPAMNTEVFFETIWGLAQDGKINGGGITDLLQRIVIGHEYREIFRLASPSDIVQRGLFAIVAPIGRLVGFQGRYAAYSDREG
jgi:quercetin dioxygenase-like cupin family protein